MIGQQKGKFWIGTSNVVVSGSKDNFPAEYRDKSRLCYYATLFNTVEINSTFKKLPRLSTFEKWRSEVDDDFRFTVKLGKEITHAKPPVVNKNYINTFINAIEQLGNKKGCLLIQFPGSITNEYSCEVEEILMAISEIDLVKNWRMAVELRNVSWYTNETFEMLRKYNACLVLHDMPKSNNLLVRADFSFFYYRFHGTKGDYRGSYSDTFLKEQAEAIKKLLAAGKDVFAYFNNTMGGAFENAVTLQSMVQE